MLRRYATPLMRRHAAVIAADAAAMPLPPAQGSLSHATTVINCCCAISSYALPRHAATIMLRAICTYTLMLRFW